jgi:putative transposase
MMGRRTDHREGTPTHPLQIVRKLREGDRLLNEGRDIAEVVRDLEIAESTWNRWRAQYGGMKADEAKRLR